MRRDIARRRDLAFGSIPQLPAVLAAMPPLSERLVVAQLSEFIPSAVANSEDFTGLIVAAKPSDKRITNFIEMYQFVILVSHSFIMTPKKRHKQFVM
jgi:hypothetical protein